MIMIDDNKDFDVDDADNGDNNGNSNKLIMTIIMINIMIFCFIHSEPAWQLLFLITQYMCDMLKMKIKSLEQKVHCSP